MSENEKDITDCSIYGVENSQYLGRRAYSGYSLTQEQFQKVLQSVRDQVAQGVLEDNPMIFPEEGEIRRAINDWERKRTEAALLRIQSEEYQREMLRQLEESKKMCGVTDYHAVKFNFPKKKSKRRIEANETYEKSQD